MRATQDLLRRRLYLTRTRAALLTHVQQTNSQYHLPEIGPKIASKANREGVAARFSQPPVPKSMEADLGLIGSDDHVLSDLE
jgi:hypothetical protein